MNLMFDARMKDDLEIAAPYLAPSPPAQCCSTLRAARCRVTLATYSLLPLFSSFPSHIFFGGRGRSVERIQSDWVCFREKEGR